MESTVPQPLACQTNEYSTARRHRMDAFGQPARPAVPQINPAVEVTYQEGGNERPAAGDSQTLASSNAVSRGSKLGRL